MGEPTGTADAPILDGVHHLKLPVADLDRTSDWYASRLGYRAAVRFTRGGQATGLVMTHPSGGPMLSFPLDPERAARVSGFDYFLVANGSSRLDNGGCAHLSDFLYSVREGEECVGGGHRALQRQLRFHGAQLA